jgi:parallel beta-helix repeat protein
MSRLPVPGGDAAAWGDILNDFLLTSHHHDGTLRLSSLPLENDPSLAANSDVRVPTQRAVKAYVDTQATPMATAVQLGKIKLTSDLAGSADGPAVKSRTTSRTVGPAGSYADYVCDGVNDHSEIQAAINEVTALGGGTIILREGVFMLGSRITIIGNNIRLAGSGNATILKMTAGANNDGIWIGNGTATPKGVVIESLKLDGNKANQTGMGCALQLLGNALSNVSDCHISAVTIVNWRYRAFTGQYTADCSVTKCSADQNGDTTDGGMKFTSSIRCLYDSVICTNGGGSGGNGLSFGPGSTYCTMTGCVIYNVPKDGIELKSSNYCTITGNTIALTGGIGISVLDGSKKNCIVGNVITNAAGSGIKVQTLSPNNTIDANSIDQTGQYGIDFRDSPGGIITSNTIDASTYSGIMISAATHTIVSSNRLELSKQHGIFNSRSSYCTITGNILKDNGMQTHNTYCDIFLDDSGGVFATYNIVTSNTIQATGTNKTKWGIREDAAGNDRNNISHNIITGPVTAAVSTLGINSIVKDNITS